MVASTEYTFKVVGTNVNGEGAAATKAAFTMPAKGSTLTVTDLTSTSFKLNWTKDASAINGYRIYKDNVQFGAAISSIETIFRDVTS